MAAALVGDDVYGEDPTINALEQRVADLLGHQAGLFCATGSMANLLGVRLLVEPGEEVVCDVQAHIARAELGAHAAVHGLTMRTYPSVRGRLNSQDIAAIIAPDAGPHLVSTKAVAVENTHNFGGGTVQDIDQLTAVAALCQERGLGFHLDGARLWNAHVASGVPLAAYGRLFDTVSVCFSKGLGAPVGSMLVSSRASASPGRECGASGWAGECGRPASWPPGPGTRWTTTSPGWPTTTPRPAPLPRRWQNERPRLWRWVRWRPTSWCSHTGSRPATAVAAAAQEQGVRVSGLGPRMIRAVTHLDVSTAQCLTAGAVLGDLLVS